MDLKKNKEEAEKAFNIDDIDFDALTLDQRLEVQKLINELEKRKIEYPILDFHPQTHQQEFMEAISARKEDGTPKYKFIFFLGGNGSGKTAFSAYATMLIALGKDLCKQFGLPYIGEASLIKVYTTTGDNIRDNIDRKYLLGTGTSKDVIKFPGYINKDTKGPVIKSVRLDKEILKEIKLKRGAVITFGTYDQGQARLQGGEPQFTWMDELPTRYEDLIEIFRGSRHKMGQILISATPTNYNKKIHDYIFSDNFKDVLFVRQVDSLENKFGDHSWMQGLTQEDIKIRRYGSFTPPEGLVYPNFNREVNVTPFVNPKELGSKVRFYGAVDFGFTHPLAFLFIAVDNDGHYYVFDMIYKKGILMRDLAKQIKDKMLEHGIPKFEWIIADSAGASERAELKAEGFPTRHTKKKKKFGVNSFRSGGILKVNQLLALGSVLVSDRCQPLIDEFEVHHFKENGDVDKNEDDALDALRYFVSEHTGHSEQRELRKTRKRVARKAQSKRRY